MVEKWNLPRQKTGTDLLRLKLWVQTQQLTLYALQIEP